MSGDGLFPGIGIGMIFGFALCFVMVSLCMAARPESQREADEEQLAALRKEGW